MVRTPSLVLCVDEFQSAVDGIVSTWRVQKAHAAQLGVATLQAASSAALMSCATRWEYFRSDWHKKAIARDATQYRAELARKLKALASEGGGNEFVAALRDVGLDVEINLPKNPTIAAVNRLRDTGDQNVSFQHQKESDRDAHRDLTPSLAVKASSLTRDDWLVIELMIAVRNAIAHGSPRAIDTMNNALARTAMVKRSADLRQLAVSQRVTASSIGRYLSATVPWGSSQEARVVAVCLYVRALGDKFRP